MKLLLASLALCLTACQGIDSRAFAQAFADTHQQGGFAYLQGQDQAPAKRVDYTCMERCTNADYQRAYCQSRCEY